MLRRKLDYAFPNQRAEVFVADAESGQPDWKPAGVWYLAGSNTCVFSNPGNGQELGATQHVVQTSNRRFRDDEFLLPLALTQGRKAIRVRVKFTPVSTTAVSGLSAAGIGLERNALHGIQLRDAEVPALRKVTDDSLGRCRTRLKASPPRHSNARFIEPMLLLAAGRCPRGRHGATN